MPTPSHGLIGRLNSMSLSVCGRTNRGFYSLRQRRYVSKPRVARLCELPWVDIGPCSSTLSGLFKDKPNNKAHPTANHSYNNPFRVGKMYICTQGTLAKPREPWALIYNAVGVKSESRFGVTTTPFNQISKSLELHLGLSHATSSSPTNLLFSLTDFAAAKTIAVTATISS